MSWELYEGDCLKIMPTFPDKHFDMILCDLPYGTTACSWDVVIPFEPLWAQYERLIKVNGAIVLTAREPFTSRLITSNIKAYKHKWVWNKKQSGSFANAKYMPLQIEEDIIVFSNGKVNYYPIMRKGKYRKKGGSKKQIESMGKFIKPNYYKYSDEYYPVNILEDFPNCSNKGSNVHPTQKPVALFEYLIKTYTKPGDLILDNCAGSGTTGVAAENMGRNSILIEKESKYCNIIRNRMSNRQTTIYEYIEKESKYCNIIRNRMSNRQTTIYEYK